MQTIENYLKKFPHYSSQALEEVLPFLQIKEIEEGEYFLRQGKFAKNIAFIEKGLLRLYYLRDGKEVTTQFLDEQNIACSYRSMITNQISEISIQAVESTKLIVLPFHSLQKLYEKNLFWQQVGRLAAESEFIVTEEHNRFLNDLSATERYLEILTNKGKLIQRVPLNYLASYLQVEPETLSRIRKKIVQT
ncbi:Crp/Fnr family transcriptional regulator [Aquimarina rhabdastrellae]